MKNDLLHLLNACAQLNRGNISYPPQQDINWISLLLAELAPLGSFWVSGIKIDLLHFLNACAQLSGGNISYPPQPGDILI